VTVSPPWWGPFPFLSYPAWFPPPIQLVDLFAGKSITPFSSDGNELYLVTVVRGLRSICSRGLVKPSVLPRQVLLMDVAIVEAGLLVTRYHTHFTGNCRRLVATRVWSWPNLFPPSLERLRRLSYFIIDALHVPRPLHLVGPKICPRARRCGWLNRQVVRDP
jgi:hypothetical protein